MGYDLNFHKRIQGRSVWLEVAGRTKPILEQVPEMVDARAQTIGVASAIAQQVRSDLLTAKIANKTIGDLILLIQQNAADEKDASCRGLMEDFCKNNSVPADLSENVDFDDDKSAIIESLKHYVSRCTEDIELLIEQSTEATENQRFVEKVWSEIMTGTLINEEMPDGIRSFREAVQEYIVDLRVKASGYGGYGPPPGARRTAGDKDDDKSSSDESGLPEGPGKVKFADKASSYSDAAKAGSSEKTSLPPTKRWVDYDSTDDEEDSFSSMLKSFGKTSVESKPYIEVPKDLEDLFPHIARAWAKIAAKWQWDVKKSDCSFHSEGFIANEFGKASEEERVEILSKLKDNDRIALNTFISFLYSVLYRPESISSGEQANLVSGYVTSLFLKEHYKKNESDANLLGISLKGGDAGENLIRARIYSCFRTGSKCANILIENVNKMLRKIIGKATKDELQSVLKCSEFCFTSYQGMMQNCYRTISKRVVVEEDSTDKRGKSKKTRKSVMRSGKDKPHLNAKELELTQKEYELVRAKETSFNRLDEVVTLTLEEIGESEDPLATAKVVKCVVDLAYSKISGIRHLNKGRRNAIRAKAQELAGPGKPLTSSDWMKAKKDIASSFEEIKDDTLACLEWDIAGIMKSLGLTKPK